MSGLECEVVHISTIFLGRPGRLLSSAPFAAVLAQSGEIRLAEKPIHERLHENRQKQA